jgi:hypothetical protein
MSLNPRTGKFNLEIMQREFRSTIFIHLKCIIMKTKIISYLAAGLFLLLFNNKVTAQEQTLPPVTVTATTNIASAVTRSFESSFKDATKDIWLTSCQKTKRTKLCSKRMVP